MAMYFLKKNLPTDQELFKSRQTTPVQRDKLGHYSE